jgi:hypothetical protein
MKKGIYSLLALAVATVSLGLLASPASAAAAPTGSSANQASTWETWVEGETGHQATCYKHEADDDGDSSNEHGVSNDDTVRLNTFNQSWPGDHWELLVIKAGSDGGPNNDGNIWTVHPAANTNYRSAFHGGHGGGFDGRHDVSHWIVCKGETPAVQVTPVAPGVLPGTCDAEGSITAPDTAQVDWTITGPITARVATATPIGNVTLIGKTVYGPYDLSQITGSPCIPDATPIKPVLTTDEECGGSDLLTITAVEGVIYRVDGEIVDFNGAATADFAAVFGDITLNVTVEAADGYELVGADLGPWSFDLDGSEECYVKVKVDKDWTFPEGFSPDGTATIVVSYGEGESTSFIFNTDGDLVDAEGTVIGSRGEVLIPVSDLPYTVSEASYDVPGFECSEIEPELELSALVDNDQIVDRDYVNIYNECDPIAEPVEPTLVEALECDALDTVTVPETEGVRYLLGDEDVSGTVIELDEGETIVITAEIQDPYVGEDDEFSFTGSDVQPCELPNGPSVTVVQACGTLTATFSNKVVLGEGQSADDAVFTFRGEQIVVAPNATPVVRAITFAEDANGGSTTVEVNGVNYTVKTDCVPAVATTTTTAAPKAAPLTEKERGDLALTGSDAGSNVEKGAALLGIGVLLVGAAALGKRRKGAIEG